jgi:hypothetical protein
MLYSHKFGILAPELTSQALIQWIFLIVYRTYDMKLTTILALILFSSQSFAVAYDDGKIDQIYTSVSGTFGVSLVGGTPAANADNTTCTSGSAWSGFVKSTQTQMLINVLMMAKASNKTVRIFTDGCESTWHKIYSVQLLE